MWHSCAFLNVQHFLNSSAFVMQHFAMAAADSPMVRLTRNEQNITLRLGLRNASALSAHIFSISANSGWF